MSWKTENIFSKSTLLLTILVATIAVAERSFPSISDQGACKEIAASYSKWVSNGGNGSYAGIPGQVAYNCLRSMPFRSDLAVKFVDEYLGYLQFQSTIEVLKSPPPDYISTSDDLIGRFEAIREKAAKNIYTSQYDFDWDIDYLISRANDGHLKVGLCSQEIMHFEHGVPLVSISEDGLQLPELYTFFDSELKLAGFTNISKLVEINDADAVYYLESNIDVRLGLQDPDARYNRLFPSHTAGFTGKSTGGAWTTYKGSWPGAASHKLRFANGTEVTIETTATWPSINGPMNYTDGNLLFEAACMPNTKSGFGTFPGSFRASPTYDLPSSGTASFPSPLISHPDDLIRGHYLNEHGLEDVAVLQVPTFEMNNKALAFAQTAVDFLKRASADGKGKLIIDMTGNGGGDVVQGFNLFQILFPGKSIYSATRFRATELIGLMGQVFSQASKFNRTFLLDPPLVYQNAVTPDQELGFASWEQRFGPKNINGANMSNLYAVFNLSLASSKEDPISGYGKVELDPPTQLFKAENIIIMSDGNCASTCVVFAELMKKQGVKSIAFGGRPYLGPMQTLGGVKGAQSWSLSQISRYVSLAHEIAVNASRDGSPILTPEQLTRFEEITPPKLENFSLRFNALGGGGVNFRNAYSEGDDITPSQFLYEAADCRLFYTAENYIQPATLWLAATNSMLGNGSCVEGSSKLG